MAKYSVTNITGDVFEIEADAFQVNENDRHYFTFLKDSGNKDDKGNSMFNFVGIIPKVTSVILVSE